MTLATCAVASVLGGNGAWVFLPRFGATRFETSGVSTLFDTEETSEPETLD